MALLVDGHVVRLAEVVDAAVAETSDGLQDARGFRCASAGHHQLGARVAGDGDVVKDEEVGLSAVLHRERTVFAPAGRGAGSGLVAGVPRCGALRRVTPMFRAPRAVPAARTHRAW